jgi:hypothetical protein
MKGIPLPHVSVWLFFSHFFPWQKVFMLLILAPVLCWKQWEGVCVWGWGGWVWGGPRWVWVCGCVCARARARMRVPTHGICLSMSWIGVPSGALKAWYTFNFGSCRPCASYHFLCAIFREPMLLCMAVIPSSVSGGIVSLKPRVTAHF